MRSLTKFLSAIALSVVASSGSADGQFKLSSLVVPQGVSYRFSQVRLTRDVEITDGTFNRNISEESLSSDSLVDKGNRVSQSANTRSHNDAVVKNAGASAGTSAHAEISLWSLGAGAEAHAEGHTKIEKDVSDVHHADDGLFETNRSETVSNVQHKNADNVVESSRGTHGNYYLVFTMTLKNLDLNDTYTVKAPADGGLRAILEGLGDQLEVPCVSAKSFTLDIGDERVCRFALKIVDEGLLAKLKNLKSLSDVRPKINGSIFPIVSDDTNKNILKEQRRAQLLNPTTEISLSFGKASMMSPWKVKRSYGKDSGRNGQKVTLRDALKAINEYVAAGDAMPEHVFEFDAEEALWRVSEREFGKVGKADEGLLGMNVGECLNGSLSLEKVGKDILDRPISEFPSIAFDEIDPKKIAEAYAGGDQKIKESFQSMVRVLKNAGEGEDIQYRLSDVLSESPDVKDREQAAELLRKLFQTKNDVRAATGLIWMYFQHPETCDYKRDLPAYVSFLIKNDKEWVSRNADSDSVAFVQETLIEDNNVPTLLAFLEEPRFEATTNGFTVLMRLASTGNVKVAQEVLAKKKLDVNSGNGQVGTALEWAAKGNHLEMCKFLVANGANPNKCFNDKDKYRTAVDMAASHNAVEVLKYLLDEAHGDIHFAQFCAVKVAATKTIRYLVGERGVDVNQGAFNGFRFMNYAVWYCDYAMCDWLINRGVNYDWDPKKEPFERPILSACRRGNMPVVDLLLSKGVKIEYEELVSLLRKGKLDWIKEGVQKKKIDKAIALLVAIGADDANAVTALLDKKDVNCPISSYNWFPLSWAAQCNSTNVAQTLVKMGANVNGKADRGLTPLQQACRAGALEMVRYLYEDCHAILDDAIFYALDEDRRNVIEYFLALRNENGEPRFPIDTYWNGRDGTLLRYAATTLGSVDACAYLIGKGASVNYTPKGCCTLVEFVMRCDKVDVLKYLIDRGEVKISGEVLEAARYGSLNCLKYMIENRGVDANYVYKDEGFLLGEAARKGQVEICKYLVSKGADVMYKPIYKKGFFSDTSYDTALAIAEREGHAETADYLRSVLQEKLKSVPWLHKESK